jgi:hypothetical protein
MNSTIHTTSLTGFLEDQVRSAAEARLLPEYRRSRTGRRVSPGAPR